MDTAPVFHPSRSKYLLITADYILPTLICLGVAFLAYFTLYSPFFAITTVTCQLDFQDCDNGVLLIELDKLKGQNIFRLDTASITRRLTSGDFTIRQAVVGRTLPATLSVQLQSVYPVVALQIAGDPTWVIMDKQFRVIAARSEDPNVPTVIVPGPLTVVIGQSPKDPSIIASLKLALRLADELFTIKSLALIDADTIELTLEDGKKAIFTPKKDELEQLRLLQVILEGATISKDTRIIDVRFDRPVLR
jgi:cell division septal protein FtsQ